MSERRVDERLLTSLSELRPRLDEVSCDIHAQPELAFAETQAVAKLTEWLGTSGFSIDKGVAGLPTAFVARHDGPTPGPTVAILLEYDALPDIGHGCGHNLIAAGGAAAAIAAVRSNPSHPGTLLAIGTPGEEGGGGKIYLLEGGVFRGVDAALMFHPADRSLRARHALACAHMRFRFRGRASHAAKNPEQGRSALAAVQLFFMAVDMLRQFVPSTARLHGIISDGGKVPNVVPDFTEALFRVRDIESESVQRLVGRVRRAAEGAAMATECEVEIDFPTPMYAERVNNDSLSRRVADYMRWLGHELEEPASSNPAGSSDIGNVSAQVPIAYPYVQIAPRGTPGHSLAMAEAANSPAARDQVERIAGALAHTALDILTTPSFRNEIWEEFRDRNGVEVHR